MALREYGSYVDLKGVGRFVEETLHEKGKWIASGESRESPCSVNFLMQIAGSRARVLLGHFRGSCE
jgi:hypothetical protein